jgi:LysR family nitrogen assimilation transcriptional regulator
MHLMTSEIDIAVVFNPPKEPRLKSQPVIEERMVCIGRHDIIGDTDEPITFEGLLDLPLILLRQGLSARAILDDASLLKKLETRARLQMNSVQAIAGCLSEGLGCLVGTNLFMRELIERGELHTRPIIEPHLTRTLHICELADRPATFALESVRRMIVDLIMHAVSTGDWTAKPIASA